MSTFQFDTITAAQALNIEATDVVQFSGGSANASAASFDAMGITVTVGARSVTFGFGLVDVSASQHLTFPDGSQLLVGGSRAEQLDGGPGNDAMFGGDGGDTLNAHEGANVLQGNAGDDVLRGGSGADTIYGGQGNDVIASGAGVGPEFGDFVNGNKGDDSVTGGAGGDTLLGGQGNDSIQGGAGDDWISGDRGNDTVAGGVGGDSFFIASDGGDDRVLDFNGAEGDRVHVQAGTALELHQVGADTLILIDHGSSTMTLAGVQASALNPDWFVSDGGVSNGGETIIGSEVTDILIGDRGDDSIQGGGGNDWIFGHFGDDTLVGGAGGDAFFAAPHAGDDRVLDFNGAEGDRVRVEAGVAFDIEQDGNDTLILIDHGSSTMRLVGVQMSTLHSDWIVNV